MDDRLLTKLGGKMLLIRTNVDYWPKAYPWAGIVK